MSIHFQSGLLEAPVEAFPNDNGNWDVTISQGHGPTEVRGDRFDRDYPAVPNQHEFRRWTGSGYDGTLDVRAELETQEMQIVRDQEQLDALPGDAWVLLPNSASRADDMPDEWVGAIINGQKRRPWQFPLVALFPTN